LQSQPQVADLFMLSGLMTQERVAIECLNLTYSWPVDHHFWFKLLFTEYSKDRFSHHSLAPSRQNPASVLALDSVYFVI